MGQRQAQWRRPRPPRAVLCSLLVVAVRAAADLPPSPPPLDGIARYFVDDLQVLRRAARERRTLEGVDVPAAPSLLITPQEAGPEEEEVGDGGEGPGEAVAEIDGRGGVNAAAVGAGLGTGTAARPSSDWWERLYQGGPLYDERTGRPLLDAAGAAAAWGGVAAAPRPVNRRSHAATVYAAALGDSGQAREWMLVSGGFADDDWRHFPVWAYSLADGRTLGAAKEAAVAAVAAAATVRDTVGDGGASEGVVQDVLGAPTWVDLTPRSGRRAPGGDDAAASANPFLDAPQGRVGHLSSTYNNCLYVFGGLTYRLGSFHVDYYGGSGGEEEGSEMPSAGDLAIWKACGLDRLLGDAGGKEE